jgi:hypothetical protein
LDLNGKVGGRGLGGLVGIYKAEVITIGEN